MYKDKEKQKQANRRWAANNRAKNNAQDTPGLENSVVPDEVVPPKVVPVCSTLNELIRPKDSMVQLTTAELEHNQRVLSKTDADVRAMLSATPLVELKASGAFIPVWREAQG